MFQGNAKSRLRAAWALVGALTVIRVAGLLVSPVELHGDEAQYWSWSQTFDFGYFSKPPLIAWMIAVTTAVFGDAEWAIRLGSPFAHAGAALFLMALAHRRWGPVEAAWAGAVYITMPAVWLSSAVISTDAFLLLAWSGGLWALDRYVDRPTWAGAAALGVFIGVGFLAKYAMIYFVVGLGVLAVLHRPTRTALRAPPVLAAAAIAAAMIAPNLVWNATNDFATLSHTAANANWGAENFRLDELASFVLDQFGVFGPIALILLVIGAVHVARTRSAASERLAPLLAFVLPALLIIMAQAFINRANANWAVASYAAGSVFVAAFALGRGWERALMASLAIHLAIGGAFATAAIAPGVANAAGLANAFKRARGWSVTTERIAEAYAAGHDGAPYAAILVDNRLLYHDVEYYSRAEPLPLRMWLRYGAPTSHAEAVAPMSADDGGPVLVVSERDADRDKIAADFAEMTPVGEVVVALGGGIERRLGLYAASGFAPLERGPAYEARWEETDR